MYYCKTVELLTCWGKLRKILERICPWQVCGHLQQKSKWKIVQRKSFVPKATMASSRTPTNKQAVMDALQMLYFFRAWKSIGFPTCSYVSLTIIGIIICQATKEMPCVHPRIQIVQIFLWTLSVMIFLIYLYFDLTTQKHPKNYELRLIKRRKGKRNGRIINLLVQHYWSYLIFVIFLRRQNFWRIKSTPKNA